MNAVFKENVSLASFSYYKIGGNARYFVQPENLNDLKACAEFIYKNGIPYYLLGAGSNVLIHDDGLDGLVIQTAKLNKTLKQSSLLQIEFGTSVLVIHLLRFCMQEGFGGLDFLVGIPGNLGGVCAMNAGTKTGEICNALTELTLYDLSTDQTRVVAKEQNQLEYSYRKQHFLKPHEIIYSGKLSVQKEDPKKVQEKIQGLLEKRKKSQPIEKPSCGSVFKNPENHSAWQLIDEAGLRGYQIGKAQISQMHSNFIVNLGGAKASDVQALIVLAKTKVKEKSGIELEEEVQFLQSDQRSSKRLLKSGGEGGPLK